MATRGGWPGAEVLANAQARIGSAVVDASEPLDDLDLSDGDVWLLVLTLGGVPRRRLRVPGPGRGADPDLVRAIVQPWLTPARVEDWIEGRLRGRLGIERPHPRRRPTCSVAICTSGRPDSVARLLAELDHLEPPPDEVIVVDNDPAGADCRTEVEAAGRRYVPAHRRGLNRARAVALEASRGELIAFIDDDCAPSAGWLAGLAELFDDSTVGAATGPAFGDPIDAPEKVWRDEVAGFVYGTRRRVHDWTTLSPMHIGRVGAGANMIFRRELLARLDPFPPELDAGTPTRSGGDLYALYTVLAAGYRIVYDPASYVHHHHPPSWPALRETLLGYGYGFSAFLAKVLAEERELGAVAAWSWLARRYAAALSSSLLARPQPTLRWARTVYLRGGLRGAPAWWRARQRLDADERGPRGGRAGRAFAPIAPAPAQPAPPPREGAPTVSAIVSDPAPGAPNGCLPPLRRHSPPGTEVIAVRPPGPGGPDRGHGEAAVIAPRSGLVAAFNAGAARAQGDVLLLLSSTHRPAQDLVAAHQAAHRDPEGARLAIGYCPAAPASTATGRYAALESEDRARTTRQAGSLTLADLTAGNVSVRRELYRRVGPMDESLPADAAIREWGARALAAGAELVAAPDAIAVRAMPHDPATALVQARRRGRGDGLLARRDERLCVPPWDGRSAAARAALAALGELLVRPRAGGWATGGLAALEALRARRAWVRGFELARDATYERERRRALTGAPPREPVLELDLDATATVPPSALPAPRLALTLGSRRLATAGARGQWDPALPRRLAADAISVSSHRRAVVRELAPRVPAGPRPASSPAADCTAITVLFGPDHRRGDLAHRAALEDRGATVEVLAGSDRTHWGGLAGAVAGARTPFVALPAPGTCPSPEWLQALATAASGTRIAVALGAEPPADPPSMRVMLRDRDWNRGLYMPVGGPPALAVVRRELCESIGGIDPEPAAAGRYGPVLDLVERALDAGLVVAHVGDADGSGGGPAWPPGGARTEWDRWRTRGALIARQAAGKGLAGGTAWLAWRGLAPLGLRLFYAIVPGNQWRLRRWGLSSAAYVAGLIRGAVAFGGGSYTRRRWR